MAKKINTNWAFIESMGYTIQQAFAYNHDTKRFVAVPLRESIEREIGFALGYKITTDADYKGPGADLRRRAFSALASSCRFVQIRCEYCRNNIDGYFCIECATASFTPEAVRALKDTPNTSATSSLVSGLKALVAVILELHELRSSV